MFNSPACPAGDYALIRLSPLHSPNHLELRVLGANLGAAGLHNRSVMELRSQRLADVSPYGEVLRAKPLLQSLS